MKWSSPVVSILPYVSHHRVVNWCRSVRPGGVRALTRPYLHVLIDSPNRPWVLPALQAQNSVALPFVIKPVAAVAFLAGAQHAKFTRRLVLPDILCENLYLNGKLAAEGGQECFRLFCAQIDQETLTFALHLAEQSKLPVQFLPSDQNPFRRNPVVTGQIANTDGGMTDEKGKERENVTKQAEETPGQHASAVGCPHAVHKGSSEVLSAVNDIPKVDVSNKDQTPANKYEWVFRSVLDLDADDGEFRTSLHTVVSFGSQD